MYRKCTAFILSHEVLSSPLMIGFCWLHNLINEKLILFKINFNIKSLINKIYDLNKLSEFLNPIKDF